MPFLLRGDRTKNNRTSPKRAPMGRDTINGKGQKRRGCWKFLKQKKVILSKKNWKLISKKNMKISVFNKFLKDNVLDLFPLIPFITFNSHPKQITGQKTFHLCKHVLVFLYLIDSRFSSWEKTGTF